MVKYNIYFFKIVHWCSMLCRKLCFNLSSKEISHGIKLKVSRVQAMHEYADTFAAHVEKKCGLPEDGQELRPKY